MRRKQKRSAVAEPTQREVIRDVLLVARQYGAWMTLRELARLTGYGEASISAQLRHLRKEQYGGFAVGKRCRAGEMGLTGGPVWEYGLGGKRRGDTNNQTLRSRAMEQLGSRKRFRGAGSLRKATKSAARALSGGAALPKRGAR